MEPLEKLQSFANPDLILTYAIKYSTSVLGALAIFILGRMAAKWVARSVKKLLRKSRLDETLVSFFGNVLFFVLLAFVIIAALGQLGIETTTVAAVFAAAGLAVGLALQNSLSNFASGVLIIAFRPFRVGDAITAAGQTGVVEEVTIFTTHLKTADNVVVIVPNSAITSGSIQNFNAKGTRRVDMVFNLSHEDDLVRAKAVFLDILSKDARILPDPAPSIGMLGMTDNAVQMAVRPWVKAADYWDVWFDTQEAVKRRFDAEGLTFPTPLRPVMMSKT